MINGWQEMLDDMHGAITTYWAEVESIIEQGDDAIIAFLMEHSEEYRQAGELQAQKFVDEWKKKLEELRNAYKQVASEINNTPIKPPSAPTTSGSSGGSSGGGGSGGSGGTTTKQFVASGTGYGEAYKATATTVTYGGQVYVKAANQNYWFLKTAAQ